MRNVKELDRIGHEILMPLVDRHEQVGDVRQHGAWAAIEFVEDKATQRPNAPAQRAFFDAVLRRGVLGISDPDKWVYRIQPALTMDPELFRWSCEQMVAAVADVLPTSR